MTLNTCKLPGCAVRILDHHLLCKEHWFKVRPETRGLINQLWRQMSGTDDTALAVNLSKKYREAVDLAIAQVESGIRNPAKPA